MKSFYSNIVLFPIALILIFPSCNFAPGSYPNAETYELHYAENEVKEAIGKVKENNPNFLVPKVTINNQGSWDLLDEQTQDPPYWYKIYFYYKDENQILFTWIRPSGKNRTTFAFVSINNGLDIGNWKDINKDFEGSDNEEQKKKFEQRILNEVKRQLEQ